MATPSSSYLVSRADRAEMEQGVARRCFAPATVLCRPARIDLGVVAVLAHIVIKKRPAGGETWHDEVGFLRAAVGERDGGPLIGVKQFQQRGRQCRIEVGTPEGLIVLRVLDDRAGIADDRNVQSKLGGDGPGTTVAASRAEHRANASSGGPGNGR